MFIRRNKKNCMKPLVSILMGSVSDFPIMEEAVKFLAEMNVPCEYHALSAHRTPELVMDLATKAKERGIKVIIAGAGGAAHLPGIIAACTSIPVIGVPIKASISIDGWDSILSILQMPSGIPVATVALNGARNAAILATQIIATSDDQLYAKLTAFKESMKRKVVEANDKLHA
jgi:5-(carboxyamino)imidazole ribonucleotide mutase